MKPPHLTARGSRVFGKDTKADAYITALGMPGLGPRLDPKSSVLGESKAKELYEHIHALEQQFADALGDDRHPGWTETESAILKAHKSLEFGRPMHLPSPRGLFHQLLLDPGPDALVTIWRMGGEAALLIVAAERGGAIHMRRCGLCPGPDIDEARLRCGHPLPCPRHPGERSWQDPDTSHIDHHHRPARVPPHR